jgi:hypothetical protein
MLRCIRTVANGSDCRFRTSALRRSMAGQGLHGEHREFARSKLCRTIHGGDQTDNTSSANSSAEKRIGVGKQISDGSSHRTRRAKNWLARRASAGRSYRSIIGAMQRRCKRGFIQQIRCMFGRFRVTCRDNLPCAQERRAAHDPLRPLAARGSRRSQTRRAARTGRLRRSLKMRGYIVAP